MSDKDALVELFYETKGNFWYRKWNWGSNEPYSRWDGITVNTSGHVHKLTLMENYMQGRIDRVESWRTFSNLAIFCLTRNSLYGTIPSKLARAEMLEELDLSWNKFSGTIPDSLFSLKHLQILRLEHNELTGIISDQLGQLTKLSFLNLSANNFTGCIPKVGHLLINLKLLDFSGNHLLEGLIPTTVSEYVAMSYEGKEVDNGAEQQDDDSDDNEDDNEDGGEYDDYDEADNR